MKKNIHFINKLKAISNILAHFIAYYEHYVLNGTIIFLLVEFLEWHSYFANSNF